MGSEGQWERLSSEVLFAGGPDEQVKLTVDQAVRPDGVTVSYPHVDVPDSVRVLAVHKGLIPVVTQHHYLSDARITDLPGGLVNRGETPVDAARRELAEETGLDAGWVHHLGTVVTARAAATEKVHLYLAHRCTPGPAAPDAGESVETDWRTWHRLAEDDVAALTSAVCPALGDASSMTAVLSAHAPIRMVGGELPPRTSSVSAAAWDAYVVTWLRDPIADPNMILVWLDLAVGRYPKAASILAELEASHAVDGEVAWNRAAEGFRVLGYAEGQPNRNALSPPTLRRKILAKWFPELA